MAHVVWVERGAKLKARSESSRQKSQIIYLKLIYLYAKPLFPSLAFQLLFIPLWVRLITNSSLYPRGFRWPQIFNLKLKNADIFFQNWDLIGKPALVWKIFGWQILAFSPKTGLSLGGLSLEKNCIIMTRFGQQTSTGFYFFKEKQRKNRDQKIKESN